jgi:hypothetical protein
MPLDRADRVHGSPKPERLNPWERWVTDSSGNAIIEFDSAAHAAWCAKWALGFRERNVGELELRVVLGGDDKGVCQVVLDERQTEVHIRVLVCCRVRGDDAPRRREYLDCPVRVWLTTPLGERAVIDVDTDEELPFYTAPYENNVPQPDHGYRPANRRRRD